MAEREVDEASLGEEFVAVHSESGISIDLIDTSERQTYGMMGGGSDNDGINSNSSIGGSSSRSEPGDMLSI